MRLESGTNVHFLYPTSNASCVCLRPASAATGAELSSSWSTAARCGLTWSDSSIQPWLLKPHFLFPPSIFCSNQWGLWKRKLPFAHLPLSSTPPCRAWRRPTTTRPLPPTTPCWCSTTRAAAPPPAPSAPCTRPRAAETRTTTTLATGGLASASWPTCTAEGTISASEPRWPQIPYPPPHPTSPSLQGSGVRGWESWENGEHGVLDQHFLYYHGTALSETCLLWRTLGTTLTPGPAGPSSC